MKTDFAVLALSFVVASLLADVISSQGQQPVLPGPPRPTPSPGRVGDPCGPYRRCLGHLCCLLTGNKKSARATCQPKGEPGEKCSEEQVKGGTYSSRCPCRIGWCPSGQDARCPYWPN
uniref:Putative ixodegrin protein n=1 Tax=Ixodes ricinus TaxID=34613 RepID=A0A0K8R4I8_IXORI